MTSDPKIQVSRLLQQGRFRESYDLLNRVEAAGYGWAALMLGDLRLSGQVFRRDLREAQRRFAAAADLGEAEAAGPAIALLGSGPANVERDWPGALQLMKRWAHLDPPARTQRMLIEEMDIDGTGELRSVPAPQIINPQPLLARFGAFLTARECSYLASLAAERLQPSVVIDPHTGAMRRDPIRTGTAAAFGLVLENPALHAINRRIAKASHTAWEQGEPVQIIAYEQGQQYRLHSDALPPGQPQRCKTMLVALTDDFAGGATAFPDLGCEIRIAKGDALLFENIGPDGRPADVMRHAGQPVTSGRKLLLSRWIRERAIDPSGPPVRPF